MQAPLWTQGLSPPALRVLSIPGSLACWWWGACGGALSCWLLPQASVPAPNSSQAHEQAHCSVSSLPAERCQQRSCSLTDHFKGCRIGVTSGVLIFNEPLDKYFAEQKKQAVDAVVKPAQAEAARPQEREPLRLWLPRNRQHSQVEHHQ